ncbi:uncharacterized protein C12orf42 homolog [Orycteropus afer afer]|uniref:Uncharacterized protein C12orf42 homolog n=1 Tax=Orycteropus afer afer TaxID=1230840 RepID=A0A8B7ASS6_ORYAF|nr:uncharacterized protein C12orf42 homolog [Orycteropus afer afer]
MGSIFPERTQNPLAHKTLLCTRRYSFPRLRYLPVYTSSSKEDSYVEVSLYSTPSGENSEASLISTVKQGIKKQARRAPKPAWSSPFLESQMAKKPTPSHTAVPVHLEAAGRHIDRHARLLNRASCNSEERPILRSPGGRPFTATRLCRRRQPPLTLQRASGSFSEPEVEQRTATTVGNLANLDCRSRLLDTPGNPTGRCAVTMTPEMLPKHPHFAGRRGPRADASLRGSLAGAPIPRLAHTAPHLSSERLIQVCSSPPSRPPGRFHKACSQAPPWPGVNARLH